MKKYLILSIILVSGVAIAGILPKRLIQQLAPIDVVGIVTFDAPYGEPNHGVTDGVCVNSLASAQWTMDEASGSVIDECNSITLTATGSTTYGVTGPNGSGDMIAVGSDISGTRFFSTADNDALDIGTSDLVLRAVICHDSILGGASRFIFDKRSLTGPAFQGWSWEIAANSTNIIDINNTTRNSFAGASGTFPTDFGCYHYEIRIDRDVQIDIFTDGVLATTVVTNADSETNNDNAEIFHLGSGQGGGGSRDFDLADASICKGLTNCPSIFDDMIGDLQGSVETFTRATTTTRYDRTLEEGKPLVVGGSAIGGPLDVDGSLPEAADQVGIFLMKQQTFAGLKVEVVLSSQAEWSATGTPIETSEATADPFGGVRAEEIEDDDGAVLEFLSQDVTIADDSTTWIYTSWIRCATPHTFSHELLLTGGTPVVVFSDQSCTTDWRRYDIAATNNSTGNVTARFFVQPTDRAVASATGSIFVFRTELYNAPSPLPIDPEVFASAVTINGDLLSYSPVTNTDEGVLSLWVYTDRDQYVTIGGSLLYWNSTEDMFIDLINTGGGTVRFGTIGLADNASVITSTLINDEAWTNICVEFEQGSSNADIFIDGTEASYSAHDESWTAGGSFSTTLNIGTNSVGDQPNARLSAAKYFNSVSSTNCADIFADEQANYP